MAAGQPGTGRRLCGAGVGAGVRADGFRPGRGGLAGEWVDDHCLVVTFPHSSKRYVASLPAENAECVREGLATIFGHIGAVPHTLVIDNASGAGHRDARGEVTLSRVFDAFVSHHRPDVRFRNPYPGNEKGSVENAVGSLRRNLMVPPMEAETHEQLTRLTFAKCDGPGKSIRYRTPDPIDMMFADDVKSLRPLPSRRFDAIRWETRKADKHGCVDIDGNRYQIGANMHGRRVDAAIWIGNGVNRDPDNPGSFILDRTKSKAGIRDVPIPSVLIPTIREHTREHCVEKTPESLLFQRHSRLTRNTMWTQDSVGHLFARARKAAKRPDTTFHTLRSTHATMLMLNGATMRETMDNCGHADLRVAIEHYQKVVPTHLRKVVELLSYDYLEDNVNGETLHLILEKLRGERDSIDEKIRQVSALLENK